MHGTRTASSSGHGRNSVTESAGYLTLRIPYPTTTSEEISMNDQEFELLAEAVRQLHTQAHNGPSDAIYAERCRREPCDTVGALLDIATGDVKGQFSIQQAS